MFDALKKLARRLPTLSFIYARSIELGALENARAEMGKGEIGKNNAGRVVDKYLTSVGRKAKSREAWCAAFISWCFIKAAEIGRVKLRFKVSSSAKRFADNMALIGHEVDPRDVRPGMVVCFYRGPKSTWKRTWKRHLAIVDDVNLEEGGPSITTIEGNVGQYPSRVARFSYNYKTWTGKLYKLVSLTPEK